MTGPSTLRACLGGVILVGATALGGCAGDSRADRATALMDEALSDDLAGCSAAAARNGEVIWAYAKGLADDTTGRAMDTHTRFDLASIGKQFTATAVLQLVEAGDLDLDTPISDVLPELGAWAGSVTVEQLMHHDSGLRDPTYAHGDEVTPETILDDLATMDGLHQDTTGFHYADSNYVLLSEIVERVTGDDFADWVTEHVFEPAGVGFEVDPYANGADIAVGHDDLDPALPAEDTVDWRGAGEVIGTPSQLVVWADHYRSPQVIAPATLAAASEAAVPAGPGVAYGPGVYIWDDGVVGHGGSGNGIVSFFGVDPTTGVALAGACNSATFDPADLSADLVTLWFDGAG